MRLDPNAWKYFKGILGKTGDNTYQVPRLDPSTHAQTTIDIEVHKVHEGLSYSAFYTRTTDATNGHRSAIFIRTPSVIEVHLTVNWACSSAAMASICEAITIDVNEGTNGIIIYNRHRGSLNTSLVLDNATVPVAGRYGTWDEVAIAAGNFASGTVLRTAPLQVGAGPKPLGSDHRGISERVLKKDTKYLFLLTNTVALANAHFIFLDWQEHTPIGA